MDARTPETEPGQPSEHPQGGDVGVAPYPIQCGLCGALLGDVAQHLAWHRDLAAATGMPDS